MKTLRTSNKNTTTLTSIFLLLVVVSFSCGTTSKTQKKESYQTNSQEEVWVRAGDIVFSEIEIPQKSTDAEKSVIYKVWRFSKSSSTNLTFGYEQYDKYENYKKEKKPSLKKEYNFAATQKQIFLGSQILIVHKFDGKRLWYTLQKK